MSIVRNTREAPYYIDGIFNHADISVTLRYIGINQDNKDKLIKGLTFKHGRK